MKANMIDKAILMMFSGCTWRWDYFNCADFRANGHMSESDTFLLSCYIQRSASVSHFSVHLAERTGSLGCVGWILVILSTILVIVLFPITIWFCVKVSEALNLEEKKTRENTCLPVVFSSCRLCRSMSALSSSGWAASQTGGPKGQVDVPNFNLYHLWKAK